MKRRFVAAMPMLIILRSVRSSGVRECKQSWYWIDIFKFYHHFTKPDSCSLRQTNKCSWLGSWFYFLFFLQLLLLSLWRSFSYWEQIMVQKEDLRIFWLVGPSAFFVTFIPVFILHVWVWRWLLLHLWKRASINRAFRFAELEMPALRRRCEKRVTTWKLKLVSRG